MVFQKHIRQIVNMQFFIYLIDFDEECLFYSIKTNDVEMDYYIGIND